MDERPLDRTRDWILGRLSPDQAERVRAEVDRDPELAAFAERFRGLVGLTALTHREAPASRSSLEQLERRLDEVDEVDEMDQVGEAEQRPGGLHGGRPVQAGRRRRAAAAALVLVAAAAAAPLLWRALGGPRELALVAIPLEERAPPTAPELPALLAEWRPVQDGAIAWLRDLDEAQRVAEASERPLFVFGSLPGCPWCVELHRGAFADPDVIALVGQELVPVELDLSGLDPDELREVMSTAYPVLEMLASDLEPFYVFSGFGYRPDGGAMQTHLLEGLARLTAPEPPTWDRLHALSRIHAQALDAEQAGELGLAYRLYVELAGEESPRAFALAGRAGLARLEEGARAALLEAHSLASTDLQAAIVLLEQARARHGGTPFERDLEALLDALRRHGSPPRLVGPS